MAFNVGQGIAAAAESIGKTAAVLTVESHRAALEKEKLELANQMAGERETKGRAESHGYALETLGKTQEHDKWRVQTTETGANARNAASVGASLESARIGARSRQAEIDAMAPVREAQIAASKAQAAGVTLDNELKTNQATARKELETATTGGDLPGIEAAKAKVSIYDEGAALRASQAKALGIETDSKALKLKADQLISGAKDELLAAQGDPTKTAEIKRKITLLESSTAEDRKEIALWQTQAKIAETAMSTTMAKLTALQNGGLLTPESQALEKYLQKVMKQQERDMAAATAQAKALLESLDPTAAKALNPGGAIDPNQFLKPKAAKPKPGVGIIDGAPLGVP